MTDRVLFAWNGGPASALALRQLELEGAYDAQALLVNFVGGATLAEDSFLALDVLAAQAAALGKELLPLALPPHAAAKERERALLPLLQDFAGPRSRVVAYPVHDQPEWRRGVEHFLISIGMRGAFPMWRVDAVEQARLFRVLGFEATVHAVDTRRLPEALLGKAWDEDFVRALPAGVDPFGDDLAFRAVVTAGENFREPVRLERGPVVELAGPVRGYRLRPA